MCHSRSMNKLARCNVKKTTRQRGNYDDDVRIKREKEKKKRKKERKRVKRKRNAKEKPNIRLSK